MQLLDHLHFILLDGRKRFFGVQILLGGDVALALNFRREGVELEGDAVFALVQKVEVGIFGE